MPVFQYKAIDATGGEVRSEVDAPDLEAAKKLLERAEVLVLELKSKDKGLDLPFFSKKSKLKDTDIIVFTRQLVTLLKAGVPLLSCLDALMEQTENADLTELIGKIHADIEGGLSFSEALRKYPDEFSELYINSIKAGEMGGALDDVLERLAGLLEHNRDTKARIKSAMRYPIIVVVSLVLAFIALMLLVVPKFIKLFQQLNVELPLPTRILIGIHTLFTDYWYILLAVAVGVSVLFKRYIKTEKGAFNWDNFRLTMPIFGPLNLKSSMSQFTRMFETLNNSGMPILQTLDITSKTVGNVVLRQNIERVAEGVLKGEGIATPLAREKLFPPMVTRMIAIGEQSGSLDEMLLNVSKHYDVEVDYAIKNLTSMIEPILTVGIGLIVLFLALAIFLPMWDLTRLAQ